MIIKQDIYSQDGVYLNSFGTQKVGKEKISIVRFNDRRKVSNRDSVNSITQKTTSIRIEGLDWEFFESEGNGGGVTDRG